MSIAKMNFELVPLDQIMEQIAHGRISEATTSASQGVNGSKDESYGGVPCERLQYPQWQKPFLEAMLELDRKKIKGRAEIARLVIVGRMQSLAQGPAAPAEQNALTDALASLRVLMREVL
jgi:hypothetical protein